MLESPLAPGEEQGEGTMEQFPPSGSTNNECNQLDAPINKSGCTPTYLFMLMVVTATTYRVLCSSKPFKAR